MWGPDFDPALDVWIDPHEPGSAGERPLHALAPDDELAPVMERRALVSVAARGKGVNLLDAPPVRPDPCRVHLARQLLRHAASCGLALPVILLRFTHAPGCHEGQVTPVCGLREQPIVRITLRSDLSLERFTTIVWHEAMHAADALAGVLYEMTPEEQERRAAAFEINAADRYMEAQA